MKRILSLFALLLLAGAVHAQSVTTASIRGLVTDTAGEIQLKPGTNTLYTSSDGDVFTIDIGPDFDQSTRRLTNPQVETRHGTTLSLQETSASVLTLDCPGGFEAVFVADETRQYQMGYCTTREAEPELARRGLTRQDVQMKTGQGFVVAVAFPIAEGGR